MTMSKGQLTRHERGCSRANAEQASCAFGAVVGMARCVVPDRVVAVGTNIRASLAFEGVAPLDAARTSQRDVPTTLDTYRASRLCQLLFLFAVLFIAGDCSRVQAKEVFAEFDQGNKLYEEGKYSEAAAVYEKVVKAGQVSA